MSGIGIKFGAEGEQEFKKALNEINQAYKVLGSEMKLVQSQFDKNDNSVEALTARNETLNKQIDAQKDKIAALKSALDNAAASFGENDKRTQAWQIKLNNAEAALNGMERDLKKNNDAIEEASSEFKDAEKAADKFGDEIKKTGKETEQAGDQFQKVGEVLKTVGKAMAAAAAAIGAGAVAAGKKIWDMANDTAAAGDTVDKMSQKLGLSAKAYQEWDYVLSQSGADIESMGAGFKSLTNLVDKATSGNDAAAASFEKLGISTKELKDMSREDIFALTVKRMQEMGDTTERAALANTIFGKSGQGLAPLLNQTAEATQELRDKANELGFVMSDEAVDASVKFTDSMDTLKRTFEGVKNSITSELLPGLTSITDGLTLLLTGSDGAKDKIKSGANEIVTAIKKAIPQATEALKTVLDVIGELAVDLLPDLLNLVVDITTQLFTSLSESLPEILPVLFDALFSLHDTLISDVFPTLLNSLMTVAGKLLDSFCEKIPELLNKLITFIGNIDLGKLLEQFLGAVEKIAAMIADNLPTIVDNLVTAIINLVKTIDWKELIASGNRILLSITDGILSAIPSLIDALPDLIEAIIDFLTDPETVIELVKGAVKLVFKLIEKLPEIFMHLISAIGRVGKKLIEGLWEGISKAGGWLWEKITGFFDGIVDKIKGFFGIHSPSTLFRDEIGKNLALGLGDGFDREMKTVAKDMENAIPTDFDADVQYTVGAAGGYRGAAFGGGTSNAYNQSFTININVDHMDNGTDLNALATNLSEIIAQQTMQRENVYA
ncbi:MAG: phage tail protein [Ruminococcus sp.]|nr:phage tail protein [Ruminococcus sp.]